MEEDDIKNTAVFWNNEYIGEAESFEYKKGTNKTMSGLNIKGKIHVVER